MQSGFSRALIASVVSAVAILPVSAQIAPAESTTTTPPAAKKPAPPMRAGTTAGRALKVKKTAGKEKDAPTAPEPWMAVDPGRAVNPHPSGAPPEPRNVVSHTPSNDPVEFGGKWNGSNDTAEKTRVDNYNNTAVGTGGEVGLKMHF